MRLLLVAVGRARPSPERDLFDQYRNRLAWTLTVKEVEEKRPLPVQERIAREGELLAACVPAGIPKVILDGRGTALSSEQLALALGNWRDRGCREIAFLIGGADGHGDFLRNQADLLLSFGTMTWPHMLVRAMLAEQIFRAESILAHHPYHRA